MRRMNGSALSTKEDIVQFIEETPELIEILRIIRKLHLPQACLCAGALRNAVWDKINGKPFRSLTDIDVIYYDASASYEESTNIEQILNEKYPDYDWEVKNQVYMHIHNPDTPPYHSVEEAISRFPETATAIGARLLTKNEIELIAPHGIQDLIQFIVQPTPFFAEDKARIELYDERIKQKNWHKQWPEISYQ